MEVQEARAQESAGSEIIPGLIEVTQKLNAHRAQSPRKRNLPEEIWNQAVVLAKEHGISFVANRLHLNSQYLKKRMHPDTPNPNFASPRHFIPVPGSLLTVAKHPQVELVSPQGHRMIIQLSGADTQSLAAIVQAFSSEAK